jgi:protein SCO1/2
MKTTVLFASALLLAGCSPRTERLPVYGQVAPFLLTAHTGREFSSAEALKGRIWIADFIFTTCMGPCPRMTQQMRWVQKQVPGVHLVSFTVDPETDTPPVLADYAKKFGADTATWTFLTGPRDRLNQLGRHTLKLHDVDGSLIHSTRFVLIDGAGRIRGYYDSTSREDLEKLVAGARELAAAK